MIRGLLLILDAGGSWNKIAQAQRGVWFILFAHLLPLLAITLGVEGYALTRLGEGRNLAGDVVVITPAAALRFELAVAILNLGVILFGAKIVQQFGKSFENPLSFVVCFRVLAYTLSPLFLAHLADGLPGINTWLCFGVGILLSLTVLYLGIPIVMRPDPAKAMGIYLMVSVLLLVMTGLSHFLAIQVLHDQVNLRFWRGLL
jgi:hypothetical protein